jgi:hypothetical protein
VNRGERFAAGLVILALALVGTTCGSSDDPCFLNLTIQQGGRCAFRDKPYSCSVGEYDYCICLVDETWHCSTVQHGLDLSTRLDMATAARDMVLSPD